MSFDLTMYEEPCPHCHRGGEVWRWDGMTYNLAGMFRKAGFYDAIKRPFDDYRDGNKGRYPPVVEKGAVAVSDVVELVRKGLADMVENEDDYRELEPDNGFGDYPGALRFTRALLQACTKHPDAFIKFTG